MKIMQYYFWLYIGTLALPFPLAVERCGRAKKTAAAKALSFSAAAAAAAAADAGKRDTECSSAEAAAAAKKDHPDSPVRYQLLMAVLVLVKCNQRGRMALLRQNNVIKLR